MTTICFDRLGVAWDGLSTNRNRVVRRDRQKVRVVDGVIFGCVGLEAAMLPGIDWYFGERLSGGPGAMPPKPDGDDAWYAIVVVTQETLREGLGLRYVSGTIGYEEHPLPFAAGSGCDYAFGAMRFGEPGGLDARGAVELVTRHLNDSGGKVQYLAYADVWPALQAVA